MKSATFLLILVTAVIAITAYSQIDNSKKIAPSENNKYLFCELVQQDRYIGSSSQETTTFMNYGKKSTYQNRFDENSYVKQQKDGIDALNYLGENGGELITKNAREINSGIEIVYILKKKVR